MNLVTCVKCGWVSYPLTRDEAEKAVLQFNEWFEKQPPETKEMFGNKPSTLNNYQCQCGGTTFREYDASKDADISGKTINPVIWERDL